MKKLFVILFLLFAVSSEAAAPSRVSTYTSGTVISSSAVTGNEDVIFNYLQAGVDTYADGTIVNADINSSANIQSDKLNLTAIAQSVANSGSTTLTGTFAANGTTNSIGNGGSDTLTLNVPGGMTLSAATTWTLTGALTFSGTIANLGTVTTANIDSGTLDGVQIGGTTATGELIVNDSNDDADGLGSQGTSGQFLQSQGIGVNPAFVDLPEKFIETNTFSSATSFTITETISSGDVYRIVIEGVEDGTSTFSPAFTINNDTSGDNYQQFNYGYTYSGSGTGGGTLINLSHSTLNNISPIGDAVTFPSGSMFYAEIILTARSSDTQIYIRFFSTKASSSMYSTTSVGTYDAGTPTTIEFRRGGGTGTVSGRNYVYKLGTTP